MVRAVLVVMPVLIVVMVVIITDDLIAHPQDRWAALLFVLGTLCGVAVDRARR
jgi:hypothetical protein